jgi:Big-like domain-containing protein
MLRLQTQKYSCSLRALAVAALIALVALMAASSAVAAEPEVEPSTLGVSVINPNPATGFTGEVYYALGCLSPCERSLAVSVTRAGETIASGPSSTVTTKLPVALQPGDVIHVFVNSSEVAAVPYTDYPRIDPIACGNATATGTIDPADAVGYSLYGPPSNNAVLSVQGPPGSEDMSYSGSAVVSGSSFAVTFPHIFENNSGVSIAEGRSEVLPHNETLVLDFQSFAGASCGVPAPSPVAECDAYWTRPRQQLAVPAEVGILGNDTDPNGSSLTAHVVSINFGLSSHSYSVDSATGALTFNPGRQTKPFKATITYNDTDTLGGVSNTATVTIWVQPNPPTVAQLEECPSASFSSTTGPSGSPTYFALGDSFSSGEGTYHYIKGTASKSGEPWDQCHRSEFAYPYLTALHTSLDIPDFDRACSGAVIDNLYEKQEHNGKEDVNEGFQLYRLQDAEASNPETYVKYVTVGIGGNDADFSSALTACVVSWAAHSKGAEIATAALTAALDGTPGIALGALTAYGKTHIPKHCKEGVKLPSFSQIEEKLTQVYRTINAKSFAPYATIFAMGYPKLFAEHPHGTCDVTHSDAEWLDDEIAEFNNYIHGAVLRAREKYGVKAVFVDQTRAFRNHELCRSSSKEPYNQAVELGFDPYFPGVVSKIVEVESFHPNIRGQQQFNRDLEECVADAAALKSGYCKPAPPS